MTEMMGMAEMRTMKMDLARTTSDQEASGPLADCPALIVKLRRDIHLRVEVAQRIATRVGMRMGRMRIGRMRHWGRTAPWDLQIRLIDMSMYQLPGGLQVFVQFAIIRISDLSNSCVGLVALGLEDLRRLHTM